MNIYSDGSVLPEPKQVVIAMTEQLSRDVVSCASSRPSVSPWTSVKCECS